MKCIQKMLQFLADYEVILSESRIIFAGFLRPPVSDLKAAINSIGLPHQRRLFIHQMVNW